MLTVAPAILNASLLIVDDQKVNVSILKVRLLNKKQNDYKKLLGQAAHECTAQLRESEPAIARTLFLSPVTRVGQQLSAQMYDLTDGIGW